MTGNLAFLPGGRGFYRGNEFLLTRAVVDFTERNRLRMVMDVTGEAALKDYRVFLHVFGDMDDLKLQLTSTPMLSQQDIITLLSLGYTSRDATVGSNLGVAAGTAAAQALFAVSGLEQQLRRFAPQTGIFQDFNVRLTSAYSKTTLTVEPRWEFETKALDGKLRVRYQAPALQPDPGPEGPAGVSSRRPRQHPGCSGTTTTPTSPEGTWAPTSSFAGSGTIERPGGPRGAARSVPPPVVAAPPVPPRPMVVEVELRLPPGEDPAPLRPLRLDPGRQAAHARDTQRTVRALYQTGQVRQRRGGHLPRRRNGRDTPGAGRGSLHARGASPPR